MFNKIKELYLSMDREDNRCFWSGYFFIIVGLGSIGCFLVDWFRGEYNDGPLVMGCVFIAYGATCVLVAIKHGNELYNDDHDQDQDH